MRYGLNTDLRALGLAASALLASCGGGDGGRGAWERDANPGLPEMVTVAPENMGDGWTPSTPTAEGMDSTALLATLDSIRNGEYRGVDSMVVIRHGRLVAEGYFNGYGRDTLHDLRSTGKSFTSALAGIAIEQGLLGLDDPISLHIPQFENHANMSDQKRAIRIFHLLNMNSALECNDWDPGSPGQEERMYDHKDWVKFILDLPMINEPGSVPSYCTGVERHTSGAGTLGAAVPAAHQHAGTRWLRLPVVEARLRPRRCGAHHRELLHFRQRRKFHLRVPGARSGGRVHGLQLQLAAHGSAVPGSRGSTAARRALTKVSPAHRRPRNQARLLGFAQALRAVILSRLGRRRDIYM
jgi:hypothetical protein